MSPCRGTVLGTVRSGGQDQAHARARPAVLCEAGFTGCYSSREFFTPLTPDECRDRLESRVLPTERRLALQLRWRSPPADRELTGEVTTTGFVIRKTLPIYAHEPALWGRFEPSHGCTRVRTYFVPSGSRWVIITSDRYSSALRSLASQLWLWLTLAVVAAASIVESWRAAEHEEFLLRILVEVLNAIEVG